MDNEVYEYEEVIPQYSSKIIEKNPFNTRDTRSYSVNYRNRNNITGTLSDGGLRMSSKLQAKQSLKNSRSYTRQSQKYEYGSKLKEKRNYVYYVSGVGYVTQNEEPKKVTIPKIVEKPKPKPVLRAAKKEEDTFVQVKKIIDNYQYHETKNLRKGKKKSNVFHQRLSKPFEYMEEIRTTKNTPYTTIKTQGDYYDEEENIENHGSNYKKNCSSYLRYNPCHTSTARTSKYVQSLKNQTPKTVLKVQYQGDNITQPKESEYNDQTYEAKERNFPQFEDKFQVVNTEGNENYYKKENYGYRNSNNRTKYSRIIRNLGNDDEFNYKIQKNKSFRSGRAGGYKYSNYESNNSKGFTNESNYRSYRKLNNLKGIISGQFQETRELICPVHGTKVIIRTGGEY